MQNKTSRNIIGPDLNEYRGDVNYTLLATQTPYAYLRGSGFGTGRFRIDRRFIEYANGLRNVGVKTGAYHYAVPSTDLTTADAQCDGFIDILQQAYGPGRYGELFPVIDIEAPLDKSISTDALLDWVDRFRKRFERRTRRKMMLYTGAFFIELYNNFYHTKKGFILADMPLWIAMYPEIQPNPPYPRDQGGWTRWRMWQFTENGTMPGVNPPVDLNYGPENLDLLTQPRNVRNFRAVPIGQEIRLTWTPNTDIDLGGYNIFINSNYVTTVGRNANSYIMRLANKPSMGEKYIMSIEAFDTDGDFSQERASANVTFGREIIESREEEVNYQWDNRWNIDMETKPDIKSEVFNDPVDSLARRFIKPVEIKENINIYDDFVETDDEFDDILYMKRLEAEMAYKRYYGNRESKDKLSLYGINKDYRCKDDCEKLEEKSKYTCPKCIKYHEEHHDHHDDDHDHHEEHHDHHDNDHDHHEEHHDHHYDDHDHHEEHHDHHDDHHELHDEHDKWDMDDYHCKKEYCNDHDNHKDDDYHENHNFHEKEYKQFFYDNDELHENHEDKSEFIKEWEKKPIKCKCDREEENQDVVLNYDYKRYERPAYDEILREEYEGDRRRLENRDSIKYNVCEECVQPKSNCVKCEYLLQDMYLNNCDYGHKHHKKKHYDYKECNDCYQSKKKKKKHHKKHHR